MIDGRPSGGAGRPRPTTAGRLGSVAPVPFVGLAALLIALIVFTPVLVATGPSPLAVQATLLVYRSVGAPTTEFAVEAYDSEVPYRWINVSLGIGFTWSGSCPTGALTWSYANGTDQVAWNVNASSEPVVVNVSAIYDKGGTRIVYAGEIAFDVVNLNSSSESLVYAPCPWTPGVTSAGSWTVSLGTDTFLLANYGSGGPS